MFVFWVFLLWLVGSFLVDAMQYASWGSVSFVSVESACRHYGVSMTSPMTSLTSLGVMFRNLEESRSRSLHVRQKYPRSSLRFNPGYAPTGAWTHPVLSRLLAAVWPYEFVQLYRPEMMDFMTVRHSNNDVLDDAEDTHKHMEQDRRAIRALK